MYPCPNPFVFTGRVFRNLQAVAPCVRHPLCPEYQRAGQLAMPVHLIISPVHLIISPAELIISTPHMDISPAVQAILHGKPPIPVASGNILPAAPVIPLTDFVP